MNDENDILRKAIDQIKSEPIPQGPPADLMEATISKLNDSASQAGEQLPQATGLFEKIGVAGNLGRLSMRIAVAAVLMLFCGYLGGRLSALGRPGTEQLREELYASLEPSLRESLEAEISTKLSDEMNHRWQLAFAKTYIQLKEELGRQYRDDLNRFAAQTLAASNATTNELLGELVQSISNAQTQDMKRIAEAIYFLEQQRLKDKTQLTKGLQALAYETDDEFQRTKQQVFKLLTYTQPATPEFDGQDELNPLDTRKE